MRNINRRIAAAALLALAAGLVTAGAAQGHEGAREHGAAHAQRHEARGGHREFHSAVHLDRGWPERREPRHEGWRGPGWAQPAYWRAGHWDHACRVGRCGWWWWAGGRWTYFDRPVYPCPPWAPGAVYFAPVPAPGYPVATY